ncbi:MAG: hypothetical protein M1837_006101 [Sclerophora amabilis]|nr:MAG: hypothetical protein M1837_006101 [Sclerophora amabilis]
MSYPPPPGLKASSPSSSSSTPQPHSSLPPRPPPSAGPLPSFKPAFSSSPSFPSGAPGTGGYRAGPQGSSNFPPTGDGAFAAFKPRQVAGATQDWRSHSPTFSAPPAPPSGFSSQVSQAGDGYRPQQYQQSQQAQHYRQPTQDAYDATSPPQIRNPFPLPGQEQSGGAGRGRGGRFQDSSLDPEMEAQIAQWQSAYAGREASEAHNRGAGRGAGRFGGQASEGPGAASGANAGPLGNRAADSATPSLSNAAVASAADSDTGVAAVVSGADGKQKTVVRSGGGQTWQDSSLLEWDPAHFRLFVGNLAGEVTDESLLKAFSRYPSVQKARVVRDKRTTKSKGYGFVSFSDGEEYFSAAREMQGKYIGSHPVLLRRSLTEIRPVVPNDKKGGKFGKGGKNNHKGGAAGGAKVDAGVQKKSNKTKGGLRVIG